MVAGFLPSVRVAASKDPGQETFIASENRAAEKLRVRASYATFTLIEDLHTNIKNQLL
jgi:hypothetical protein